jgi:hypothetical protein
MSKNQSKWSDKEKAYLRKHWASKTQNEIAAVLGKTPNAVMCKAYALGLKKRKYKAVTEIKYGAPHEDDLLPARQTPHITVVKHAAGTITTHRMRG